MSDLHDDLELYVMGEHDEPAEIEAALADDEALRASMASQARFEALLRDAAAVAELCRGCGDLVRIERCNACVDEGADRPADSGQRGSSDDVTAKPLSFDSTPETRASKDPLSSSTESSSRVATPPPPPAAPTRPSASAPPPSTVIPPLARIPPGAVVPTTGRSVGAVPAILLPPVFTRAADDHRRELQNCENGAQLHGRIRVRVMCDSNGRVTEAKARDEAMTSAQHKVMTCIVKEIYKFQFPKQGPTGAQGMYVFQFH